MRYSSPGCDRRSRLEEAYSRHAAKQLDAIKGIEAAKSAGAEEGLRRGIRGSSRARRSGVPQRLGADVLRRSRQVAGFLLFVLFLWVGALLVATAR